MAILLEDIKTGSDWLVRAFASDGYKLDYTINSFIEIDIFYEKNCKNGKPTPNGRFSKNLGPTLFSIGSYIGETLIRNIEGSHWDTDDTNPEGEVVAAIVFPDGAQCLPMLRARNRFLEGAEDSIYVYGHALAKEFIDVSFDPTFWKRMEQAHNTSRKWWKFW